MKHEVEGRLLTPVRFKHGMSPYNAGEQAGFPEDVALRLVNEGLADYVDPDDDPRLKEQPLPVELPKGELKSRKPSSKKAKSKGDNDEVETVPSSLKEENGDGGEDGQGQDGQDRQGGEVDGADGAGADEAGDSEATPD
jgi:hypothetical protein